MLSSTEEVEGRVELVVSLTISHPSLKAYAIDQMELQVVFTTIRIELAPLKTPHLRRALNSNVRLLMRCTNSTSKCKRSSPGIALFFATVIVDSPN